VVDEDDGEPPEWRIRVEDAAGGTVLAPPDRWSPRHRTYILWGEGDRVWVWSADVGTSVWEPADGGWSPADTDPARRPPPPALLRREVPRFFGGA
jgi:hypothetical protein